MKSQQIRIELMPLEPADSDASPPRQNSSRTSAAVKQEPYDSDASPPRQQTRRGDSGMSSSVKIKEEPDSDASPPRQGAKQVWRLTQSVSLFLQSSNQSQGWFGQYFFLRLSNTHFSQPTRPLKQFANTKNKLVKLVLEDLWVF